MAFINGCLSALGYALNTIFWVVPIVLLALLKLIPFSPWQKFISYLLDGCASGWVTVNTVNQYLFSRTALHANDIPSLSTKNWYMVISNHQSWVDILVLQRVLHGKVPFLKFFLKAQLIFVPVIGLAWWALDFPFMRRYSREFLAKNPHLVGKDIEATQASCQKFKLKPVSVMNFVEGTRFTDAKWNKQQSPHRDLLKPKAGGLAFALNAMSGSIDQLVNVTIVYPDGVPSFWQFISGQVKRVEIDIELCKLESSLVGDYENDPEFKQHFQQWLNELWQDKQNKIQQMKQ